MAAVVSGASFGAAMVAAGFYDPAVVIEQLKFTNWHMVQAFLAATATSAIIYNVAERLGRAKLQPRSSSPIGLFAAYDGNIIGGSLLGAGMALSGSCPGTLFAQLAGGVRTGVHALDGAVIGGILWTGFLSRLAKRSAERAGVKPRVSTVDQELGLSRFATLFIFEAVCVAVIAVTAVYTPPFPGASLLGGVGGVLIGLTQLVSLATRKSLIGISGSYEEVGNTFWWLVGGARSDPNAKPRSYQNILFALGAGAGAYATALAAPELVAAPAFEVAPVLATLGGALMVVGSRLAGGCTSGHGISGISLLSTSSIITIASTFGAGFIVASLVH